MCAYSFMLNCDILFASWDFKLTILINIYVSVGRPQTRVIIHNTDTQTCIYINNNNLDGEKKILNVTGCSYLSRIKICFTYSVICRKI